MTTKKAAERLQYGARKYAAFSLLVSRWTRCGVELAKDHVFVTLAGTELGDVRALHFIDPGLVMHAIAFESNRERHELAKQSETTMRDAGISLTVSAANLFDYERLNDSPHIFFIDGLGIFAWADYDARIGKMFQQQTIKEGDCLLITSHLGHRPGIDDIQKTFSGELSVLGVSTDEDVARLFRRAHPSFTLFRALTKYRLAQELKLRCFGCIKYRDTTPMGIYGYTVGAGATDLRELVEDTKTSYFDMNAVAACPPKDF